MYDDDNRSSASDVDRGATLAGGPPGLADSAWEAALHLLEAPFLRPKAFLFVDQEARSVDWEGLLEESATWSHGERLLVAAAHDLRTGAGGLSIKQLVASLDDANFSRLMLAVHMARGWHRSGLGSRGGGPDR